MKLLLYTVIICFSWMIFLNNVKTTDDDCEEDCEESEGYSDEEEVEEVTNDYCYSCFECEPPPNGDDCDFAIDSLCSMMKPTFYSSEPMNMPMDKPMKSNTSIRGLCHMCRFGSTTNKYFNKEFRELTFGMAMPHLYIKADTDFNLLVFKQKKTVLANVTDLAIRMVFHVCDANISRSSMKKFNAYGIKNRRPGLALAFLEAGKLLKVPKLIIQPFFELILALLPLLVPSVVPKDKLAAVGMIGGCPMSGGPKG